MHGHGDLHLSAALLIEKVESIQMVRENIQPSLTAAPDLAEGIYLKHDACLQNIHNIDVRVKTVNT